MNDFKAVPIQLMEVLRLSYSLWIPEKLVDRPYFSSKEAYKRDWFQFHLQEVFFQLQNILVNIVSSSSSSVPEKISKYFLQGFITLSIL